MKHRTKEQQKGSVTPRSFRWSSGKAAAPQNITWALKCICLVALFFRPVFSIHFDFILWTYCMSRWLRGAAPVVGREAQAGAKGC